MISFLCTPDESQLIAQIVRRASALAEIDYQTLFMDITACHANGCPLDLAALLQAPDLDFYHDVCGIRRHINRETGLLEDSFLPRCAQSQHCA